MLSDMRIAVRSLIKSRGFTVAAVVTLGLGLALCAIVLLVLNAYLFRSLPYPGAERLYSVRYAAPGQPAPRNMEALDWRSLDDVIEYPIAWDLDVFYLIGGEHAESAPGAWVTPGFVRGLGIQPALGRGFDADAFQPGATNVALISHRLWQSRYGGEPSVIGRTFQAYVSDRPDEAESFTIIGVLPANFWHLNTYTDVLTPLRAPTYPYMVRLRNGVPPAAAADRISALVRSGASVSDPNWRAELTSTHAAYVVRVRPVLRAIAVAAGLVLLISLANVAGLLLIRTTRRQKEFAVRRALGASRLAIARLLVLEAIVLGFGATMLGVMASSVVMGWLAPVIERELGRSAPGGTGAFEPDLAIVVAAAVCGLVAAGACAVAPLLASWRVGLRSALHSGNRAATEGRGSQRTRSVLIALEIAASLTLVAGSTLMVQSVVNLLQVDFGIRAANVLSMPVTLRQRTYPEPASRLAFFEETLARIGAAPGVQSVALTDWWPLQPPQPRPVETDSSGQRATAQTGVIGATAEYFSLLGIPLVAGRAFTAGDRLGSADVAIVSETLARRLWPGGSPVGSQLRLIRENADGRTQTIARQVVGVVKDVRQVPDDPDLADLYVPILQSPGRFVWVYARTAGPPAEALPQLRAAVNTIDREIPMTGAAPLQQALDGQLARPKFLASLLASFALIAALLALVGIYGVIAYAVRQREREIAVRIAVGAEPRRITGLFLKQGVLLLVAGLGIGVIGAVGAGRTLESQLFGVRPGDPLTLLMAATGLAGAAMLAVWWPARRAAATDPAAALKDE